CTGNCGTLNILPPPTAPATTSTAITCSNSKAMFGAPPAITSASTTEIAVVTATAHDAGEDNIWSYFGQCQNSHASIPLLTSALSGVSVSTSTWFFSHSAGFTSAAQKSNGIDTTTAISYSGSVPVLAGPGVSANTDVFF